MPVLESLFNKVASNCIKKEAQMFFCKDYEIFKNSIYKKDNK